MTGCVACDVRPLILIAVAASVGAAELRAQGEGPIERRVRVGDRVRLAVADTVVRAPSHLPTRRVIGTIRAIAPEALYLDVAAAGVGGRVAVPRILIQKVERSLGPPSRVESAKELGLAGAFVLGVLVAPLLGERGGPFPSEVEARLVGAGVGWVGGTLVGLLRPYERWRGGWIPE